MVSLAETQVSGAGAAGFDHLGLSGYGRPTGDYDAATIIGPGVPESPFGVFH